MIQSKITLCLAAILILKMVSCGPIVQANAVPAPTKEAENPSARETLQSLSLIIPQWDQGLQDLAKIEVEVPSRVAGILARVGKNLSDAQDLVKQGLSSEDPLQAALRLAQSRGKIAMARAALSRAETASRESRADESLSRALLALGQRIDSDLMEVGISQRLF